MEPVKYSWFSPVFVDRKNRSAIIFLLARRADHSLEMISRIRQRIEISVSYPAFFMISCQAEQSPARVKTLRRKIMKKLSVSHRGISWAL